MSTPGTEGYGALFADINKVKGDNKEAKEGVVSDLLDELELDLKDDELIALKKKWENQYAKYESTILKKQKTNEDYWLGRNKLFPELNTTDNDKPNADNLIFESLETLIPIATRQNPEPVVEADNTIEGNALADKVQKMLVHIGEEISLKLSLKTLVRYWSLYFLGVGKVGWSVVNKEVSLNIVRPQKLILDPDATIINGIYNGDFIGEKRKDKASDLVKRFPKKKKFIEEVVDGHMGTEMNYVEWWTDDYTFWSYKDEVLNKIKNPHWNYGSSQPITDEKGQVTQQNVPGKNHFPTPLKPYLFLSVFNIGIHPHDDTNLVHQNLKLQDMVTKRLKQIDINADNTNGGSVVSGDHFTKDQAAQVSQALRNGDTIWVPTGDVNAAFLRTTGTPLAPFVYQSLTDYRNELKNNFGVRGSSAGGTTQEKTVRGKLITKGSDTDRIGGGITEYIEQFSDLVYNWFVQLMYVYYDEEHAATVIGKERAKEYITLKNSEFGPKLSIQVKDGSLIPKDSMSKRNEAIELFTAGALDPIALFEALEFPNPKDSAKQLLMWTMNPMSLFPDMQQPLVPGQVLGAPLGQPGAQPPIQQPPPPEGAVAPITNLPPL